MTKAVLCLDIDGTLIRYGVLDENASVLFTETEDMPPDGDALRAQIPALVNRLKASHPVCGVAISTTGMVECVRGIVFHAPEHILGYDGTNWKELIEKECALPCETESDVNCAGLSEYISGAAMSASSSLCMTIGAGIGGCLIIDGNIWRGATLSACKIGYLPMYGSTFETLGSTGALIRKVRAIKGKLSFDWDGERIFAEALKGDRDCVRAIDEMCDVLGRGIATVCFVTNPEIVILGGGIMSQHHVLLPKIRASMEKYLIEPVMLNTFIASAAHGELAGLLGAFYHFRRMREGD